MYVISFKGKVTGFIINTIFYLRDTIFVNNFSYEIKITELEKKTFYNQ